MKENLLKKIKNAFKRVLAILGTSATIMLPTGSEALRNENLDKVEDAIKGNKDKISDELNEGAKTVEGELEKLLSEKIEVTKVTEHNEMPKIDDKKTTETSTESYTTTTKDNNKKDDKNVVGSYDSLLNKLNDEFNKKGFSRDSYKYIKAVFDNTYKNYDSWKSINKDLPSKKEYIIDNIINNIKNINSINIYSSESKEGKKLLDNGSALGFTDSNFNITLIDNENEKNDLVIERMAHEFAHINQKDIVFNDEYFKGYEYLRNVIIEGGATTGMKYSKELKTEKTASDIIELGEYCLEYKSDNGEGYPKEMNIYNNLMYLVGYNVMDKINSGAPISTIETAISKKYGEETSNKIFRELKELDNAYKNSNNKAKMKAATDFQKEVLKCIEKDISELKTEKQVREYTNIYRAYKINNLSKIYRKDIDFTDGYFDIDKLDQKMIGKIKDTKAFEFSNDTNALECLLYTTNEQILDGIYLPANLEDVTYKYENGKLYLNYTNKSSFNSTNNKNTTIEMNNLGKGIAIEEVNIDKNGFAILDSSRIDNEIQI